jgi:hypothetical protein
VRKKEVENMEEISIKSSTDILSSPLDDFPADVNLSFLSSDMTSPLEEHPER